MREPRELLPGEERLASVEKFYLDELMRTADANEGLAAFIEKRKPVWKGR